MMQYLEAIIYSRFHMYLTEYDTDRSNEFDKWLWPYYLCPLAVIEAGQLAIGQL